MASVEDLSLVQENIDEFVNDENKIVTCRWLSLTLNLKINAAKRALYTFVERQRKEKSSNDINVTYFVAGLGKSKSGDLEHKCVVVPETEVAIVKKALLAVTSCHIYSVQRTTLKDYTPLYQTDYDVIIQNLEHSSSFSSIKCDWVAQRVVKLPAAATAKVSSLQKPEKSESPAAGGGNLSVPVATTSNTKKTQPKGSIASMFAAAASTGQKKGGVEVTESTGSKAADKSVNASNKAKASGKKGGVQSFFSKNGVSKKTTPETGHSEQSIKVEKKEEPLRTMKADDSDEELDRKRRKRIRTDLFDSSESEDDEENELNRRMSGEERESPILFSSENKDVSGIHDDDDEEETCKLAETAKEEEEECSKVCENVANRENQNVSNGSGRKRKRAMKTVTKQYQDDDGFLVTKKEVIWESESDNSEPEEVVTVEELKKTDSAAVRQNNKPTANHKAEPKGKTAIKKTTSPQKGKQTSLTSFFKRK